MTAAPQTVGLTSGDIRFLAGCAAGLAEQTAIVEIAVSGAVVADVACEARMRAGAAALYPEEPLLRLSFEDWPSAFLVPDDPDTGCADPATAWLGRWVVAVTVAIQRWARDPVFFGRVVRAEPGRLVLAIPWRRQALFTEVLRMALELVAQWAGSPTATQFAVSRHFGERWVEIQNNGVAPYTLSFVRAGADRGIPFSVLPSCLQLGWGAHAERFDMSFTSKTSWMANALAKNKAKAARTMAAAVLPVPASRVVADPDAALRAATELGWPVVVKPLNQELGSGVTPGVRDAETLKAAFARADRFSARNVVVEKHIDGDDYRMLVVNGRLLMAVRRVPAGVTGDGIRTVAELVDIVNADPRRGTRRYSLLKKLTFDDEANRCLADENLAPDSVPAAGRWVGLRRIANISSGGTAHDVTAVVHPDNAAMAVRAARVVGLDIAGVDFLTTDISRSWRDIGGAVCEINAQPGFSPHWLADPGRDIDGEVLDILFAGRSPRIPVAAITGGGAGRAARTAELLAGIWQAAGVLPGACTSARLRVGDDVVSTSDLTGLTGARIILEDPGVEAAVLELPGVAVRAAGHPCDRYDVVLLLDGWRGEDPGAHTVDEFPRRAGRALVLDADAADAATAAPGRHLLVAAGPDGRAVAEHRRAGGEAVFTARRDDGQNWIVLALGPIEHPLVPAGSVAEADLLPAMFAAAGAWAHGLDLGPIRSGLGVAG